jgi:hypothetical protein
MVILLFSLASLSAMNMVVNVAVVVGFTTLGSEDGEENNS